MRLAGGFVAAIAGFALAATFMDAPARWFDAMRASRREARELKTPAISADEAPAQIGRSLAARTRALEAFADRCATQQWDQAEELRDSAGRAELEGDRSLAEELYEQATDLYDEARSKAALRRAQGGCLDQSLYSEMPHPPSPPDPGSSRPGEPLPDEGPGRVEAPEFPDPNPREGPSEAAGDEPEPPPLRPPPALEPEPEEDPQAQDDAEISLRARASALAQRDPCAAARLLREQGRAQRTLVLGREYFERCRRRPR